MTRRISRIATMAVLTLALAGCGVSLNQGPGAVGGGHFGGLPTAGGQGSEAGFRNWVQSFRPRALAAGISPATFDSAMAGAHYQPGIVALDRKQSEFTKPVWEYLDGAIGTRGATGRAKAAQYAGTLSAIEARYGVPREIVLAVWGMESNFGANRGNTRIVPALATLAYDGRRGEFFAGELVAALRIIQSGDVDSAHMVGSWAGAMGHTQFMPSSFLGHAVDFNGDGRRDIWSDDPTDALASTASYLRQNGWRPGQSWGTEVILPPGFDFNQAGKSVQHSGSQWAAMGVRTVSGAPVPSGSILAPAGARGPAFLITENFRAILKYNASDSYALGVAYLGEAIAGRRGIQGSWPRGDRTLSNSEKAEIQRLLMARGFDTGGVDGKLGSQSTEAIKAFQRSRGVTPDGYADTRLLAMLRG
ncbi:lytic murein transglycosylase [Paracoccus sp. P2]|uniref:Lytic murein transglycosylase n=1 Tax=Paracoccus pantotrophus TaxID=82367 RepID=A0A1I5E3J6_PARPN|nr:lytic murein transglycosylase [Paracoccus pantotrophus]MDF3853242.1 lytic murein transglycosylase [Paracoccus pantotrophus]QFG36858.1 lytic murein transglycosylase [Paracoccus pantotrophus]QLH14423.1 lytic murein transglycosylase [Paracoccus pantotrophus]RDD97409.1 lytic murein transglycosylase [Paracoccus pantotrophus]RKS52738.1 membrane-bound lytic murein transglycosylase B [Paracoccus pantotrophus]